MITDILMKTGGWAIDLRDDTPSSIRDLLFLETVGFGHIVITPARIEDPALSWSSLLGLARYTGVYRGENDGRSKIFGPGPGIWLGDEDGKGPVIGRASAGGGAGTNKETSNPFTISGQTFQASVGLLRPDSLAAGSVEAAGGSYTRSWTNTVIRAALDELLDFFTREYRIRPNLKLDAGSQTYLYPTTTTPTAVVQSRSGGTDANIVGIRATKFDTGKDLDDYTTEVILIASSGVGAASIWPAIPYTDAFGNLVRLERVEQGANVGAGNENEAALAQLNRFTSVRQHVKIGVGHDVGDDVKTGDTIYVFEPDLDLYDLTNQVPYRGETIFPTTMRVMGSTSPVREGMGAYFRPGGGAITDLSDWFKPETSDTTLDVGAVPRTLT